MLCEIKKPEVYSVNWRVECNKKDYKKNRKGIIRKNLAYGQT
jgi:hypothetical protein